ncbi:MAG: hypothetical protein FWC86_02140 [Coriobacteriia bacterium]|nr:hypothetical protein [Coriobacteriia bacterium]
MNHRDRNTSRESVRPSPVLKKLAMMACLMAILLTSAFAIFHTQSTVSQASLSSEQKQEDLPSPGDVNLEGIPLVQAGRDESSQLKARSAATKMEETANLSLAEILSQTFRSESTVEGSVHYDFPSTTEPDSSSELRVEAYIKLSFQTDEEVDNFNPAKFDDFYDRLHKAGIAYSGERLSLLFSGPQSARLFACLGNEGDSEGNPQIEELTL